MFEADICPIVTVSLEHRENDVGVGFKSKRPAYLQHVAVDLEGYFTRSVDEAVERACDDHDLSLAIPADDARVLRRAWVNRSRSAVRRE